MLLTILAFNFQGQKSKVKNKYARRPLFQFIEPTHCCFQQWKNFQNWSTADKVIAKSSTPCFL